MTAIQFGKAFNRLKWLDVKAGAVIGNADHVRAQKIGDISYAIDLGMKVFLIGLSVALLQCVLTFLWMFGSNQLNFLGALAQGFILLMLGRSLYPDGGFFTLPLSINLGISSLIGMAAGLHGIDANLTLQASVPLISLSFGCLFALYILSVLTKTIRDAFTTSPEPRLRPSFERLRKAGLVSSKEYLDLKRVGWTVVALFFCLAIIAVLWLFTLPNQNPIFVPATFGLLAAFVGLAIAVFKGIRVERKIYERLESEGQIKPVEWRYTYTIEISEQAGYEMAGMKYLNGKTYPTSYDINLDRLPMRREDRAAISELKKSLESTSKRRTVLFK